MRLKWITGLVLAATALYAQSLDQSTSLLLNHAKADRDLFGAGRPGMFSLEEQAKKGNSDVHINSIEDDWIAPEVADRHLLGTANGADLYLDRMLRENDVAVTGKISKQISLFNTNKTTIVTDSLLVVDNVLHVKAGIHAQSGDLLVVTREGGRMHVDKHEVQVNVEGFAPFVTGKEYLLFLFKDPRTESYRVSADGAFFIDGNNIKALSTRGPHPAAPYLQDQGTFREMITAKAKGVDK